MNTQHALPPITLAANDYNRLLFTAMFRPKPGRRKANFLLEELRRAKVCHPAALPEDVVSTNCRVIYRVDDEAKSRAHLLAHPEDLIWPGAEISVTTPLGAALLGLRVGDRMPFVEADGQVHEVFVEGIGLRFLDDSSMVTRAPDVFAWS
ncbi:GreA/GreB family elongation factor [Microvirga lotononidis]|uniref:Transcription elongation factor n=1 Tax=Microvirga lotononidis TaxID=864069 RepID=I4Z0T5_9HYPH|nr:GreA/GreB family elongation factor [Microvirga lotononidis]EIM29827.1 transcription elongation factor [Microvirga lotononidis]WQO31084.1 GreA/GreB family elongation factor [Microvirga lotononidis]